MYYREGPRKVGFRAELILGISKVISPLDFIMGLSIVWQLTAFLYSKSRIQNQEQKTR